MLEITKAKGISMVNLFCFTDIMENGSLFRLARIFACLNLITVPYGNFSQYLLTFVSAQTKKQIHENQRFVKMKKLFLFLLLSILMSPSLFSQDLPNLLNINEIPLRIGVLVDTVLEDGKLVGRAGTAFLIKKESDFFLVTAAHVAKNISKNGTLSFRSDTNELLSLRLSNLFFPNKSTKLIWDISDSSDVAVVKLSNLGKFKSSLERFCFKYEMLMAPLYYYPRDLQTYYFGYPYYFNAKYNACFSQRSFFSSGLILCEVVETKNKMGHHLTLEDPSIQGFSGGPVMINVKSGALFSGEPETRIIGIVSGTMPDNTGGKTGLIAPAYYIAKVINNYK